MNFTIIFRLLSIVIGALACAFAVSLGIALIHDRPANDAIAVDGFVVSTLVAGTLAVSLYALGRGGQNRLFRREAMIVIGLGWIISSIVGAIPYFLILPDITLGGAVFESASGLTTTGASVLTNLETLPKSLLFWRSTSQWFGGLGVVVFFVAILASLGAGAKVLFTRESSATSAELDATRVQSGIRRLLLFYLALSVVCTVVFWLAGMNWFDAVNHMMTTLSTGGFSTRSNSIADFHSPLIEWLVVLFMVIGGTSFIVLIKALRGDLAAIMRSTEVKAYFFIILVATALVVVFRYVEGTPIEASQHTVIRSAAFQVVSIMTTTGFATEDFDLWLPATHVILLVLMAVGGCSGSTAGGLKVIRIAIAWRVIVRAVERSFRIRLVRPLYANREPLDETTIESIVVYTVLATFVIGISILIVAFMEPSMSLEGTISATAASFFNIGPGFAEVGPTRNFAFLDETTQLFLSLVMILGRLELYAVLALFMPSLWRK